MLPPVLEIFVVWHPEDREGVEFATAIFRHFLEGRSFLGVTVGAAVLSVVCFWGGVLASFLLSTPTGASVVLVDLAVFLLLSLYGLLRRRK